MKILNELRDLIPPLTRDESIALEQSIQKEGVRDALSIAMIGGDSVLIDGHNRHRIATKLKLPYQTKVIETVTSIDEAIVWMIDNQQGRRNLTDGWKWELAQKKKEVLLRKGREKQKETLKQNSDTTVLSIIDKTDNEQPKQFTAHNTRKELASSLGWSTGKVAMADKVWKEAKPEIKEKVKSGDMSISAAYKEVRKKDDSYKDRLEKKSDEATPMQPVRVCAFGDGMYRKSSTRSEDRYGDKVFSLSDDKYNTVSTLSRFYHRETMLEFTLREYAQVQTFPDDYNFVGTYSTIKKQIGNAVAPFMGRYITEPLKGKTIGDLFAGAGGFSCGAHQNGKVTKWAVEWEEDAATTFKFNNPDTEVYNANIKDIDPSKLEKVDIIIGGPPCQGFSSANHENKKVSGAERFIDDSRNLLYKEFVRFVNVLQPTEFVMENVQEIYEVKDEIIADFEQLGYSVHVTLVAGNDIGMKQNRKRCFFIGNKNA